MYSLSGLKRIEDEIRRKELLSLDNDHNFDDPELGRDMRQEMTSMLERERLVQSHSALDRALVSVVSVHCYRSSNYCNIQQDST